MIQITRCINLCHLYLFLEKLHLAGARDVALGPGGAHGLARAWLGGAPLTPGDRWRSVESGGFEDDFLEEKNWKIWENYGKYRGIWGNHGNSWENHGKM